MRDALLGSRVRLVNVHAADWTAELSGCGKGVGIFATDGVVEDEDADRSGTAYRVQFLFHKLWGLSTTYASFSSCSVSG